MSCKALCKLQASYLLCVRVCDLGGGLLTIADLYRCTIRSCFCFAYVVLHNAVVSCYLVGTLGHYIFAHCKICQCCLIYVPLLCHLAQLDYLAGAVARSGYCKGDLFFILVRYRMSCKALCKLQASYFIFLFIRNIDGRSSRQDVIIDAAIYTLHQRLHFSSFRSAVVRMEDEVIALLIGLINFIAIRCFGFGQLIAIIRRSAAFIYWRQFFELNFTIVICCFSLRASAFNSRRTILCDFHLL